MLWMKFFDWDKKKSEQLKQERNISFEEVVIAITNNHVLDIIEHPNKMQYPNQKVYIIEIEKYVYLVPFVEDNEKYFLKTIFASRKMTKKYLGGDKV